MQKEGLLLMRQCEVDRLKVINEVLKGQLKQRQAAKQLDLSVRQIKRLCHRVRVEGNGGIVHLLRGRASNHRLNEEILKEALELVDSRYQDFGPTLANEKLRGVHGIKISTFALRQGMMRADIWKARKQKTKHRAWRRRRDCMGELVQLDGSTHQWFEDRGPMCVLIAYIDDATGRVLYAEFAESEDTLTLMRSTRAYLEGSGRPTAFYVDKDSIYKVNRQASIEEQLRDSEPVTQFTRAMVELGIEVITAHSPQAKGRVERLFGTLQDRLVKELRLENISTIAKANQFLGDQFLAEYNERFAVPARSPVDAHRPMLKSQRLDEILSIRSERTLMNDFTLRYQNQYFQLSAEQPVRLSPQDKVWVETRLDGTMHLRFKDRYLAFQEIQKKDRVASVERKATRAVKASKRYKPASTHPWRRLLLVNKNNVDRLSSFQSR
jgi:transposase